MKMTKLTNVMKNLVFPLMVGGILLSGSARAADIVSIKSDVANHVFNTSGTYVEFKITLNGTFVLTNAFNASQAFYPDLRMITSGDMTYNDTAYATLFSVSQYTSSGFPRTDCIFRYRINPGDMAQPLKIYGSTTVPYFLNTKGWAIRSATNLNVDAIWEFDPNNYKAFPPWNDVFDLDLTKANITISTLTLAGSTPVPASENTTWHVASVLPTESAGIPFVVWSPNTNILAFVPNGISGTVEAPTVFRDSMATNTTAANFLFKGLTTGDAVLYLQRATDYANNGRLGVTNYYKTTVTFTTPPAPTVRIIMADTGQNSTTLNESDTVTGSFQIQLSETFSNEVWVSVSASTSNVTFAQSPFIVKVPIGQLSSSPVSLFNTPDGTAYSANPGVTLTATVLTNNAAQLKYTRTLPAVVIVKNVKPSVTISTVVPNAIMNAPFAFSWLASDVAADLATGMTVTWDFGDGTVTNVPGSSGSISHTFAGAANSYTKTVTVTAHDKDGLDSDSVTRTVTVLIPSPQPFVGVAVSPKRYDETNDVGALTVYLSEGSFPGGGNVFVMLNTDPANQGNIRFSTNIVKILYGSTNSEPIDITILDGTVASSVSGITIIPSFTNNAAANAYFTDRRETALFVKNVRPVVTLPVARDISLTPLPQYTNVVMGRPFSFAYSVKDVTADASSMIVTWTFGDGSSAVVTGAVGSVQHTYAISGASRSTMFLSVQATDKDGGQSDLIEFPVYLVAPPPPPTVRILSPAGASYETSAPNTGSFIVQLSEAFGTNVVTVDLTTTPPNSPSNGTIILSTNRVVFGVGEVEKTVRFSAKDGTDASWTTGFTVTPSVFGNAAAKNYFLDVSVGTVEIINVNPVILNPTPSDTTAAAIYQVAQGSASVFDWSVDDVPADTNSSMTVVWTFGDNTAPQTVHGGTGSISHTYTVTGDVIVRMQVWDKDGGYSQVLFKITVAPSKSVVVTPMGPNTESAYYGAPGLGNGMVFSKEALSGQNRNNVYFFSYAPSATSATLEAVPYKTAPAGYYNVTNYDNTGVAVVNPTQILYDSFFFVWVGVDQGIAASKLDPATTTSATVISLPTTSAGTGGTTTSVDIRDVAAIFSQEWRVKDNLGDINQDGIPDKIAINIETKINAGGTSTSGSLPIGLANISGYNGDLDDVGNAVGDFWPLNPSGANGRFDFRPVGKAFTAFDEVRGIDVGLNQTGVSDLDGVLDEPGTDPTLADTDGDGFPDGYEYYFWYNAKFNGLKGAKFNPADVSVGNLLDSKEIQLAFEPSQLTATRDGKNLSPIAPANRDLDGDGLYDVEELVIGTSPINWDTDGDGICDTWEVLHGMDPNNPTDGLSATANNPDGDYMAYASVAREFATVVTGGTRTNTYLAVGVASGDVATNGTFTTWYHYGTSNDFLAVGCPVSLGTNSFVVATPVNTNALVLHFQVFREFGFDPRTAWTTTLNAFAPSLSRFPTWIADAVNTKPFTSVDEYLLMKFMSETRMNGAPALMTAPNWAAYTTDPMTPDSDATAAVVDGMPDGWELYVSVDPTKDLSVAANRVMAISPWNELDGDVDHPTVASRDGLINRREFAGTDSSAAYANAALYNKSNFVGVVSIVRPAVDANWLNKFWPTNPWVADTDGDGVNDLAERAFMYGTVVDNGTTCIQGGGLNPNAMDTDLDGLPDGWEVEFTGTAPTAAIAYSGIVITNGMDGTVSDFDQDWDHDGLLNYQEYYVQAVRSFRYDVPAFGVPAGPQGPGHSGLAGLPTDITFDPSSLFTLVANPWDVSKYPWGDKQPNLWVMLPVGSNKKYVSTDPRNPDTDFDGMDDFYEMYHGLNPILGDVAQPGTLGDRVARAYLKQGAYQIDYGSKTLGNDWGLDLPMDFVTYPWLAGLPEADPDADGLRNFEEMLMPNSAAPPYHNTDPSPIWLTDDSSVDSVTTRYYSPLPGLGLKMYFWPGTANVPAYGAFKMFSFEMNEGYDTDNDGVSDKAELTQGAGGNSDPQDQDDPIRRQAIWFDGVQSAAQTLVAYEYGMWGFRSFTVELWAYPTVVDRDQVLVERPIQYDMSDLSTPTPTVRRNFRVGIAADGRIYAMFENAGLHDSHTGIVKAYGRQLVTNEWLHVTARMDGANGQFVLFVNGRAEATVATELIPANGVLNVSTDPAGPHYTFYPATLVLGAANIHPVLDATLGEVPSWQYYEQFFRGYLDEVRIWDGARSDAEIAADFRKRYKKVDLLANRRLIEGETVLGFSRVIGDPNQLSPELKYHFTFDNLFSAQLPTATAQVPRGFDDVQCYTNRPHGIDTVVGWWSGLQAILHSDVYAEYGYIPWIENGVAHLPLVGNVTVTNNPLTGMIDVVEQGLVKDSRYWTSTSIGGSTTPVTNYFPNANDPYGYVYNTDPTPLLAAYGVASDLLPMGGAFAKTMPDMWDMQGASGFWGDSRADADSDGLPDWWEAYVASLYPGLGDINWYTVYPDGSGMTMGERYLRDMASPQKPLVGDTNLNGLPDWWEAQMALLYPGVALSWTNAYPDGSGLTMGQRYLRDRSDFQAPFTYDTDHDGLPDWWEAYAANIGVTVSSEWTTTNVCTDGSGLTLGQRYLKDLAAFGVTNHAGDADFNGLPDWWDAAVTNSAGVKLGWADPYPANPSRTCGEQYILDFNTFGATARVGDTNANGIPDWWEGYQASLYPSAINLTWTSGFTNGATVTVMDRYTLDMQTFTGANRQINDSDWDGLPNWWERYALAVNPSLNASTLVWNSAYPTNGTPPITAGQKYQQDLIAVTGAEGQALDDDHDGLPNWFEATVAALYPEAGDLNWSSIYPDGSGLTAGARYLAIWKSVGMPLAGDANANGLPDWWEAKVRAQYPSATNLTWNSPFPNTNNVVQSTGTSYLQYLADSGVPQSGDTDFDGLPDWWEWYAASANRVDNPYSGLTDYYPTNTYSWSSSYPTLAGSVTAGEAFLYDMTNRLATVGLPPTGDRDFDGLPDWWEMYAAATVPAALVPAATNLSWQTTYPGSANTAGEMYLAALLRETNDLDNDGLPDWWELYVLSQYPGMGNLGWNDLYPDASGKTMGESYLLYLAASDLTSVGTVQRGDSDFDGLPDWWEQMFGLDPNDATGVNGPDGDPDMDGLSNYYEYLAQTNPYDPDSDGDGVFDIDEDMDGDGLSNGEELTYGTNPANVDTDSDGLTDFDEIQAGTDPLNPLSPYVRRTLVNDGTGYLAIPKAPMSRGQILDVDGSRFNLSDWTLSAQVKLTANPVNDVIVIQRLVTSANQTLANYELGIDHGTLKPYIRFQTTLGREFRLNGYRPLEINEWTQIGGRLGPSDRTGSRQLSLFSDYTAISEDISEGYCVTNVQSGDLVIAKNLIGEIDEVQVWRQPRTDNEIEMMRGKTLLFGYITNEFVYVDSTGVKSVYPYGQLGTNVLASGAVALYLPFDDGRQSVSGNPALDAPLKVSAVDDFVHYADGWQQTQSYAGTLVGGIDFNPLTNSLTPVFPIAVGSPQSIDSDGDGMPDAYEVFYGLDPNNDGNTGVYDLGPDGDPDGDGLPNLYEYYAGTNPWVADSNGDGINDADTDSDGDGLTNIDEYRMGSHPMRVDTDDDGINDGVEVRSGSNPAFSDSPDGRLKSMRLNGTATYRIPAPEFDRKRFNNASWTVETWVRPDTATQTGPLVKYAGIVSPNGILHDVVFYELGLDNGVPYVRMDTGMQSPVASRVNGGALVAGEWTHVAGVFDAKKNALTLYLNGIGVASLLVSESGLAGSATANATPGKAFIGSVGGVSGNIDELRIWKQALTQDDILAGIAHLVPAGDKRLVCYFRFDDGGLTAEDYAHPIRPPRVFNTLSLAWPGNLDTPLLYCMGGVIFDASTAYTGTRQEVDDTDGDKLPDWWEAFTQFRKVAYPITEVVYNNQTTIKTNVANGVTNFVPTTKIIEADLRVKEERTEIINPGAERSSSVLDLGWGIAYGPVMTVPQYFSAFDQKMEGRWCETPDSAWLFNDVYMTAEQVATAELRFNFNDRAKAGSEIYINGKLIKVADLVAPQFLFTYVPHEDATIQIDWWAEYSVYALDADFVKQGQYFKVGWNRIAVKHSNEEMPTYQDLRYELFSLKLTADRGQTTLIDYGARWWIYAHAGSTVEPPVDAAGLVWSDENYGLDTNADPDDDGLSNYYEFLVGTNPNSKDTDGNGVLDSEEDFDGDGLSNILEMQIGTDARLPDTDDDGVLDSVDGYLGGAFSGQLWATNALLPKVDRYLSLDGSGYLEAPSLKRWGTGMNSFTLRMSVKPYTLPAAGTTNVLAERQVYAGVYNYALRLLPGGNVQALVSINTGSGAPGNIAVISSAVLSVNEWADLTMVVDVDRQQLSLLVKGVISGAATADMRQLAAASGTGLVHTRFGVGFNGAIDNIALYSAALSESAISLVSQKGILAYPTDQLQGCYLFDDGTSPVGVSGVAGWKTGQVQDFACIFWSKDQQTAGSFGPDDWKTGWHNAGTMVGAQSAIRNHLSDAALALVDSDNDGMPDVWEIKHGLDPYSDKGDNGARGDPDHDELSNYQEYLISEVYKFYPGLDPKRFSTAGTVSDYFLKQGYLYYGEMFADHDFMEDAWEDQFDPYYVSRYVYDPFGDQDEDGWSNWAECRYSYARRPVRPDLLTETDAQGQTSLSLPVPTIVTRLTYAGHQSSSAGNLCIVVYSNPEMNGLPDATYAIPYGSATGGNAATTKKTEPLGSFTEATRSGFLSPGAVQPGTINLQFTDQWTGIQTLTGFDNNGTLYAGVSSGAYQPIGTIDYVTGKYSLDLSYYKGQSIHVNSNTVSNRADYIEIGNSTINMLYMPSTLTVVDGWPKTLYLGLADTGYVREGTNYFFAFLDLNSSKSWDAGEPCGVATPFATDIGWDVNSLNIQLTDYTQGYLRMTLNGRSSEDVMTGSGTAAGGNANGSAAESRVRVRRTLADGYSNYQRIVLDKVMKSPRTYLNECDLLGQGDLGLDWGLVDMPTSMNRERFVYDVYVGNAELLTNNTHIATFTNLYDVGSDRVQAKANSPINGKYVYSAMPTFKWTMPAGYTAFAIEIKKGSSTGKYVFQSGTLQAPVRDYNTDEYVWEAPIHAGDILPNGEKFTSNTLYAWRVIALNSKFTLTTTPITWSTWNVFRLDVNAPVGSAGYGEIKAVVKYFGPATSLLSGRVKVQVFNNQGFNGVPAQQYTLDANDLVALVLPNTNQVNAVLRGLTPSSTAGNYYVRAFIDHNTNQVRDVWESWGYANYYGESVTPYSARPFTVAASIASEVATVIIEDADSDQDWFPDAWEYEQNPTAADFLNLIGPSGIETSGDMEINPNLLTGAALASKSLFAALAFGTTDHDGDGVGDLAELILGMNPNAVSTAGDGYTDADKLSLGLSGSDTLAFGLTAINRAGSGKTDLTWKLDVTKAASVSRAFLSALTGVASDGDVHYYIDYTPSLLNANWQNVRQGTVKLDGGSTIVEPPIDSQGVIDPDKGFFRVRLFK